MLRGEIKVNDSEITAWSAVRKENIDIDVHRYECVVNGYRPNGYPFNLEFDVYHSYKKGAVYLASLVLAEAYHRLGSEQ